MQSNRRRFFVGALGTGLAAALPLPSRAQPAYPARPINIIVPFAPGGMTDILARQLAATIQRDLKQPGIVDNRLGAGGIIGADRVAKARADGYTLLVTTTAHVVSPAIVKKLPYDTVKDFQPIALLARTPNVLLVNPTNPARSLAELLAFARQKGSFTYGSSGTGGTTHLSGELLAAKTGAPLVHVPYKGTALALNDLLGGQIDGAFVDALSAVQYVKAGALRAIAVSTRERVAALSEVPTVAQQGVADYETEIWIGLYAPAGTPTAIVTRLNALAQRAMGAADFRKVLEERGTTAGTLGADAFSGFVKAETAKWQSIVALARIQPD